MKDIFADIYDRVLSFFNSQNDDTKLVAKNRLRTVLMQDRVGFSERAMQMLKDDLIDSISKYLEINVDSFNLSIDAADNATILNLSIPVLRPKTDEEIDEALSLQEQVKIEKTEEIVDELKELVKEKAQKLAEQMSEDGSAETEQTDETEETDEDTKNSDEKEKPIKKEETPEAVAKEEVKEKPKTNKKNK